MSDERTIDDLIGMVFDLQKGQRGLECENSALRARVRELEKENAELRSKLEGGGKKGGNTPEWVKANTPDRPRKERKKRDTAHFRQRQTPTRTVEHAHDNCPDCGRPLSGGTVHHSRQVVDIPPVTVEVVEHQYISRHCGVCAKNYVPKVDLEGEVLGTHRIGLRLMSLVSYLATTARVPRQTIQSILVSLYGVEISYGEISKILSSVAKRCSPESERILEEIRRKDWMHSDETGWREGGKNGYIWCLSTPDYRYFLWNKSRSGQVAKDLIGEDYGGVVVSDFYSGYNALLCRHQWCWVHYLRDLHKLVESHQDDESVRSWVDKIKAIYKAAKEATQRDVKDRKRQRRRFEARLLELATPYLKTTAPQRVLAQRIERYGHEMFTFVENPRIPPENNAAERAVRPAVIARKISGGSRSDDGTKTRMTLMSLFGTWLLQGLDGVEACRSLLSGRSLLFPEPV